MELLAKPPYLTQVDLYELFSYNRSADQLARLKKRLCENGLAIEVRLDDGGYSKTVLVATQLLQESQAIESQIVGDSKVISGQTLPRPGTSVSGQSGPARARYGVENSRGSAARKNSAARNKERKA